MSSHKSLQITIDFVSDLPNEISEIIFLDLPITTLFICRRVSKSWKQIVEKDDIWRSKFQDQKYWKYYHDELETDSWYELYKELYLLESNWKNGKFTKHKLSGHFAETQCVKFFKNWIITGSKDCTIRIWDNETFHCLRILGKPNIENLREELSEMEEVGSTINEDIKFHLVEVNCIDINDKYLVSGSCDGSCIIWELPDFKSIDRLIISSQRSLGINDIALYNDYIVGCNDDYIEIWKSSLDNLDQLQFNLQHRLHGGGYGSDIRINNGILYSRRYYTVTTWNIETGQIIQEYRFDLISRVRVNDQYLIVGLSNKVTVLDLHTNKENTLSDKPVYDLCVINNKIISVDDDCTIKIWNLKDLKLLKEFKDSKHRKLNLWPVFSISADSKRLAAFTMEGDIVIYDFTENLREKYLKHL